MSCGFLQASLATWCSLELVESWMLPVHRMKWKRHEGAEGACKGVIILMTDCGI